MSGRVSISLRLTLWFGCAFFAGWALFGVSMWINLGNTLKNERRLTLARRMDRLQDLLLKGLSEPEPDRYDDFVDFAHATGNGLVEVFQPGGARAWPSPSAAATDFPWPALPSTNTDLFRRVQSAGQFYWVYARPFSLSGRPLVLMAAAPEAGNLLVMRSFLWGLLASVPVLLCVSSAGGYWVSRRALRPVDDITATARSISIGNISDRVPVSRTGDELQRLAETCNAMLDRLESSVNQIKRFTADASHELRGPLTFTRTVAEIALRNPKADSESRHAFQDIVEEAAKAAVLLEDMLALARADSLPVSLQRTQIDLAAIVAETLELARPIARQLGLALLGDGSHAEAIVLGDAPSLKRLLWILLDNAMKYSHPGGTVEVSLWTVAGRPQIAVRDNGIGIAPADLPLIFDRFYRADPSRGMVEGNGLGLSIAKWIAETHQAQLSVVSEERKGTSFTVTFAKQEPPSPLGVAKKDHAMAHA